MCEGRQNTVRAGWKRVDVDDVERTTQLTHDARIIAEQLAPLG